MGASESSFGNYLDGESLKIQRFLPGPIQRVWDYLTDSDLRSQWLAAGVMNPEPGSEFEFVWRNSELDGGPARGKAADDPECAAEEFRMSSEIVSWEPPYRLVFTWSGSGNVIVELEERGEEVLLTLTHFKLPDRATIIGVSSGWHAHLDYLLARLANTQPEPFWDNYNRLREHYEKRVAELS